ncbi:ABC transporter permease [Aerococcaceae bacterium DSM 111176]|nr:ABC transporter permease [Aerococcaceae bacterium DSM 111176]
MNTLNDLWQKRFNYFLKEVGKYGRLIFNDHLAIILFVLLGFGSLAYNSILEQASQMPSEDLYIWVILVGVILLSAVFLIGQPLWLTRRADESYLFPRGHEFNQYWLRGTFIAEVIPMIGLALSAVLYYPFLVLISGWTMNQLWLFIIFLLLARLSSSLLMYLNIYRLGPKITRILRSRLPFVLPFMIFTTALIALPELIAVSLCSVALVLVAVYIIWAMTKRDDSLIDFDYVIEMDSRRDANFYRAVSLFADVPQSDPTITRREYLDFLFKNIPTLNNNRYGYLFIRQLFRNSLYSSIWIKVTLFMTVIILVLEVPWMIAGAGVLGFLMSAIQLLPLIHFYDKHPFQIIYPNRADEKLVAFQQSVLIVLGIQFVFYTIAALIGLGFQLEIVFVVLAWSVALVTISYLYIPWWNRRHNKKK